MSKRVITTVLSSEAVAKILAGHLLAARQIEPADESQVETEMMAVFDKNEAGKVFVSQFRVEVTLDEKKESWRG